MDLLFIHFGHCLHVCQNPNGHARGLIGYTGLYNWRESEVRETLSGLFNRESRYICNSYITGSRVLYNS